MQDKTDTYSFTVDPFDTDCNNRLSWHVLGTRILSAATHHARRRGFDQFEKDHIPYLWVLSRMVVEIDHWPCVHENYSLSTWIRNYYRYFTDRYFLLLDDRGVPIGRILTIWAMINSQTRMPTELSSIFGNSFDQYIHLDDTVDIRRSRIRVNTPMIQTERSTFYSDLDTNGHVNSIRYIEYVLDSLPSQLTMSHPAKRIEMEYCAESYVGNLLNISIEEASPLLYHAEITKPADGKATTVCRSAVTF